MHRILALLVPGYAQARNGHRGKAAAFAGGLLAALLLAAATPWLHSFAGLVSFLLGVLGGVVWSSLDARRHHAAAPRPPGTRLLLLLCAPLVLAVALVVPATRERVFGLGVYRIPGGHAAGAPALLGGDRFMAGLGGGPVGRGTLALFRAPGECDITYVKRIVALGGDVVRGGGEGVFVNGRRVAGPVEPFGPVAVAPGEAFALSDNPPEGRDSRHFGPIPEAAILGRPLYVLWGGWSRVGRDLR